MEPLSGVGPLRPGLGPRVGQLAARSAANLAAEAHRRERRLFLAREVPVKALALFPTCSHMDHSRVESSQPPS